MSTKIKYKGETVTSIDGGQTATLHLTNKKLTDDLVIEASGGSNLPVYNGEYVSLGAPKEATVTITNTSGAYMAEVWCTDLGGNVDYIGFRKTKTYTVPIGVTLYLSAQDAIIRAWETTAITGDIEATNTSYNRGFLINGDGTITGYAYDAD